MIYSNGIYYFSEILSPYIFSSLGMDKMKVYVALTYKSDYFFLYVMYELFFNSELSYNIAS